MTIFVNLFFCEMRFAICAIAYWQFKVFQCRWSLMHAMRYMFVVMYRDLAILEFGLQGGILLSFL